MRDQNAKILQLEQSSPICALGTGFPVKAICGEGSGFGVIFEDFRANKQ